jgi:hypothetical protein
VSLADLLPWALSWDKLHEAAHMAAATHYSRLLDYDTRYQAALDEITMLVATAEEPPSWHTLKSAGLAGINTAVKAEIHHHGLEGSGRTGRRFATFWHASNSSQQAPFEEALLDRMALEAVWACLTPADRAILWAAGFYETGMEAAASLGKPVESYWARLSLARARARALWADWEPPARHYGHDSARRGGTADEVTLLRQRISRRRVSQRKQNRAA